MDFDAELVAVHRRLVAIAERRYGRGCARDLAAETVARAYAARGRYDGRPLLAWCRVIMRNVWLNERALRRRSELPLGRYDVAGGVDADQRVLVREILSVVREWRARSVAVDTLVDFAMGKDIATIARERGVPVGTVKRRIHDARLLLKKLVNVNEPGRHG